MVDVNASEVLADGFDEKCGDDGRIDSSGEGQKDLSVPDLLLQCGYLFIDECFCEFRSCDALHGIRAYVAVHEITSYDETRHVLFLKNTVGNYPNREDLLSHIFN